MGSSKPLLSICIPTYNRAHLLESALIALASQVKNAGNSVELIVSDNCSPDNTKQVVEKACEFVPIRYHRNNQNEGFARNVLRLTNELANGEFAWLLGDDDLVRPGGVQRVLNAINNYPEVDYVFVNLTSLSSKERPQLSYAESTSIIDSFGLLPTKAKSLEDRYVDKWEELIDPDIDDVFMGAMMCSVFRLSCWREYRLDLKIVDNIFSSLEHIYPHSVILAHTMIGRKAYYIGYPCVVIFFGDQGWNSYLPLIYTVLLQEKLDLYLNLGIDIKRIEKCRDSLLGASLVELQAMILDSNTSGREYFSLFKFVQRNRHHRRKLIYLFALILRNRLPKPVQKALRFVKRNILRF